MKSDRIAPYTSVSIPEGRADVFVLSNRNGMEARITNYGGILLSLKVPDREGIADNVVLGFDSPAEYCTPAYLKENPFLGAVVGRNANVIRNARFPIDGRDITLAKNFGQHNLHGGNKGFDKFLWEAEQTVTGGRQDLRLYRESPDGEEGFPGNLRVTVLYSLTEDNELVVRFQAESDQKTLVNLTQHSYFHLGGEGRGQVLDHELMIDADAYVEFDRELVPTGFIKQVQGTPMDFRTPQKIGSRIRADFDQLKFGEGYDATYALNKPDETPQATVWHQPSGRYLELYTTLPGIQLYTGNSLNENVKNGYGPWSAFCLETQYFPDGPNHSHFPSGILSGGQAFDHQTRFRFSVR